MAAEIKVTDEAILAARAAHHEMLHGPVKHVDGEIIFPASRDAWEAAIQSAINVLFRPVGCVATRDIKLIESGEQPDAGYDLWPVSSARECDRIVYVIKESS
jgi:hypothetical protein